MKKYNYHKLSEHNTSGIPPGGYDPSGNGFYEISYLLGYGFAWISNYIGTHSQTYGLAFK